jgi:hypothetical protein
MRQTIDVCRDCHRAIHDLLPDEKDLGRHFNTREALLAHEPMARFIAWLRRQR